MPTELHPDIARALVLMFTDRAEHYVSRGNLVRATVMIAAAKAAGADTPEGKGVGG